MAEVLYLNGARNFIYMTLPPLDRTPAGPSHPSTPFLWVSCYPSLFPHSKLIPDLNGWYKDRVQNWNTNLTLQLNQYASLRSDKRADLYDTSNIFNRVLDNPEKYGFVSSHEVCNGAQCIWFDNFHPGSAFYKFLAADFACSWRKGTWNKGRVRWLLKGWSLWANNTVASNSVPKLWHRFYLDGGQMDGESTN
jgi:hypothetical protein